MLMKGGSTSFKEIPLGYPKNIWIADLSGGRFVHVVSHHRDELYPSISYRPLKFRGNISS